MTSSEAISTSPRRPSTMRTMSGARPRGGMKSIARSEPPAAVLRRPEQGGEARAGVEAGEAEPVDGAPAADQCRRLEVADESVILDVGHRGTACGAGVRTRGLCPRVRLKR